MCSALPHNVTLYVGGKGEIFSTAVSKLYTPWNIELKICASIPEWNSTKAPGWSNVSSQTCVFSEAKNYIQRQYQPDCGLTVHFLCHYHTGLYLWAIFWTEVCLCCIEEDSFLLVVEGLLTHFKGGFGEFKLNYTLIRLSWRGAVMGQTGLFVPFWDKCTTAMWVMFVETFYLKNWWRNGTAVRSWGLHLWKMAVKEHFQLQTDKCPRGVWITEVRLYIMTTWTIVKTF